MSILIPVAGGKGGVGKSIVSLNMAIAVAAQCKKVILCDFDLGAANLHTMLGLKNNQAGLGNYIYRQQDRLENLVQATGIPNLYFIAGDCLFPGAANMDFFTKKKLMKDLFRLQTDYLILDLGAGSSYNVLDFYLMTYDGILVVTPEITSILNAYSFLKSAIFRFYYRQFSPKSPERQILKDSLTQRMEGKNYSFLQILDTISEQFPESGEKAMAELKKFSPRIIMNMGKNRSDAAMGIRLRNIVKNKLAINIEYIGFMPYDEHVQVSIASRQPVAIQYPQSPFSSVLGPLAQKILAASAPDTAKLQDDIEKLVEDYYAEQN